MLAEGLSGAAAPESYGTGRICIEPSCEVHLSRYNSTDWCALHESPAATGRPYDTSVRPRGRRRPPGCRLMAAPPDAELVDDAPPDLAAPIAAISARLPPPGHCLWPTSEDPPFRWCGVRVAQRGSPYCRKHVAAARHRTGRV